MFTVKTRLEISKINGIGVFADEFIAKGTIVWKYQENFDITLDKKEFNNLPKIAQDYIIHYNYYNENEGGYILCGDNAKFTNHSITPNIEKLNNLETIDIKDIKIGYEITENYFVFDELANLKLGL